LQFKSSAQLVAAIALFFGSSGANAGLVPDSSILEELYSNNAACGGNCPSIISTTSGTLVGAGGNSAGASGSPLSASANGNGSSLAATSALGEVIFYFEVLGPSGQLPLDIDVALHASLGFTDPNVQGASADASIQVQANNSLFLLFFQQAACQNAPGACDTPDFVGTLQGKVLANTVYEETLRAAAGGLDQPGFAGFNTASALVDPYLYIDPSFANASAYTLVLSDGIANTPTPVPLPGALGLFGFGLAQAGLMAGRRPTSRPGKVSTGVHH